MKRNILRTALAGTLLLAGLTACNDWLDLRPSNAQVPADFWKTKEEVEAVVNSGYIYLRKNVANLLYWGELRGGTIYSGSGGEQEKLENFDLLPSNAICSYEGFYKVINMANSVLANAPGVQSEDDTYYNSILNSHLCEAYFLRAYTYSILVKNYREVPLVTEAYETDAAEFNLPKASEAQIIAQIKSDIRAAEATKAAKTFYEGNTPDEQDRNTKARATCWALYAVMADICLWNHDYDECIEYCDKILKATEAMRPAFITDMSRWFEIFYPGNSNEAIFEINFMASTDRESNPIQGRFSISGASGLNITDRAKEKMRAEVEEYKSNNITWGDRYGRMVMATFVCGSSDPGYNSYESPSSSYYVWKYRGTDVVEVTNITQGDANFILYRVADIILMKAEAEVMKGESSWPEAIQLVNQIRRRAGLADLDDSNLDERSLLLEVLDQRDMEFVAEGKRWYDVLRFARYDSNFNPEDDLGSTTSSAAAGTTPVSNRYMNDAIGLILAGNQTGNAKQIQSVLSDPWAWYLPIPKSDIETNDRLKQNPYYANSK